MSKTNYLPSLMIGGPHDDSWVKIADGAPSIQIPIRVPTSLRRDSCAATKPPPDHRALYVFDRRLHAVNEAPVFRYAGTEPTAEAEKLAASLYDECAHLYRDDRAWINHMAAAITAIREAATEQTAESEPARRGGTE